VIKTMRLPVRITKNLDEADVLVLLSSYKKHRKIIDAAEARQLPVHMVRANTIYQIQKALRTIMQLDAPSEEEEEMFREMDDPDFALKMMHPDF
jgi:hypothetical protein